MKQHIVTSLFVLEASVSLAFVVSKPSSSSSAATSLKDTLTAGGDVNPPIPQYTDPKFWNPKSANYEIIDWDKFDAQNPAPPKVYDPIQFHDGLEGDNYNPTFWYHRTPLAFNVKSKVSEVSGVHNFDKVTDLSTYSTMLHPDNPHCPDVLRGVFWMRDNIQAPETLACFSGWAWKSNAMTRGGMVGMGSLRYNWSHDPSNYGALFINATANAVGGVQIHPNGKWIALIMIPDDPEDETALCTYFYIYVIQPGEEFFDADGNKIDYLKPGDLLRLSWNGADPYAVSNDELTYFYTPRKMAHLDANGNTLLHQENIEALIEKATQTSRDVKRSGNKYFKKPSWFGFWSGGMTARQRAELNRQQINLVQVWQQAPYPPTAAEIDNL